MATSKTSQPASASGLLSRDRVSVRQPTLNRASIGLPWPRDWRALVEAWLGPRLFHFDMHPAFPHHWTAIVSSHQHRHQTTSSEWFQRLEHALRSLRHDHSAVLYSQDTPMGEILEHLLIRFEIPRLQLHSPGKRESLAAWQTRLSKLPGNSATPGHAHVYLSPLQIDCLTDEPATQGGGSTAQLPATEEDDDLRHIPSVDRCLVALPDRVHALHLRTGGKLTHLVQRRLEVETYAPASLRVQLPSPTFSELADAPTVMQSLLGMGAVGWYAWHTDTSLEPPQHPSSALSCSRPTTYSPLVECSADWLAKWSEADWPYLTHCTRARQGAWPDQSVGQYRDEVLLADGLTRPDPLLTLERILDQQRLIATDWLRSGDQPTVCFSAVPLDRLLKRRCFRSHVGRWDWEPYGICIRRDWMMKLGACPVTYVDQVTWHSLSPPERRYAQPTGAQPTGTHPTGGRSNQRDVTAWSDEKEWRLVEDLRLHLIPFDAAFVFVPSHTEAVRIAPRSRWPVLVVPSVTH